jgi:hypothetical protein
MCTQSTLRRSLHSPATLGAPQCPLNQIPLLYRAARGIGQLQRRNMHNCSPEPAPCSSNN